MPKKEIEEITEPVETDSDVISEITSDFNKAYKYKLPKEQLFKEIYRRYRSYLEVSRTTTRSTLFIPESFKAVETVAPRLTAKKPSFKVLPRTSDDISKADGVGALLEYRYDYMNLQQTIKTYAKQGLIYGTSIMKMGWDGVKKCPQAKVVDIADIFTDNSETWDEGFIFHRYYVCLDDLQKSKIKYENLDQLELQEQTAVKDDTMRQDRFSIQDISYDSTREGIECLEQWYMDEGEIWVRTLANRTVLIRNEKSPLPLNEFPFIPFFDQEVPFEKWGIGEIEQIIDLQDEENTTRNQRIDEKNLSIYNMFIVSKTAGVDYKNLVSKPGGILLANDINGIKPLDKQNITQNSIEEIRMIKDDIKGTNGTYDAVVGAGNSSSATESALNADQGNQRFTEKSNNLEISMKRIAKWIVALDAAFASKDFKIRVLGKYGYEEKIVPLEDIKGEYDIDIESGSSLPSNPDLRRQQLRELLQVITPILSNPAGIPDGMREFLRTLIQSYDLKNADEILQGAAHPVVSQAMANLDPAEMEGANPQMVQAEIQRQLTGAGALNQTPEMQGGEQPPMREQTPNPQVF